MSEKPIRSIVKALSWRITATIITTIISLIITTRIEFALSIGLIDLGIKLCVYYLHERLWNKITFGLHKKYPPDYII